MFINVKKTINAKTMWKINGVTITHENNMQLNRAVHISLNKLHFKAFK